jgi:hypothetical protein
LTIIFHLGKDENDVKLPGLVHAAAKVKENMKSYFEAIRIIRQDVVCIPSEGNVHAMIRGAVKIEKAQVTEIKQLFGNLELLTPISCEDINIKIEAIADETLKSLGYGHLYGAKDPLSWIDGFAKKEAKRYCQEQDVDVKIVSENSNSLDNSAAFSIKEDF